MVKISLIVAGCLAIVLTLLPLVRRTEWWVRLGDFPRVQIALGALGVLGGYLYVEPIDAVAEYVFGGALIASVLYQVASMLPYTPLYPKQVMPSARVKDDAVCSLMVANVLMTNRETSKLLAAIAEHDPMLVLAVETSEWWKTQLDALAPRYPYCVPHAIDNTYGMVLYSKLELINPQIEFLVQDDIPSIHTRVKLESGDEFELHCVHPRPPFPTEDDKSTERDAELLLVGKRVKASPCASIVAGDLNDVAWSRTTTMFQKISGLLDPRIGRGFFNTFHASYPFIRFPLDHVFHSHHFRLISLKRLAHFGSDHFPVFITLSYEPEIKHTQDKPEAADHEERQEAEAKIEEAEARN
ncbi:MAG: endonuclease/exonuclease/phosphatase family protein [Pyrinomonadaceae bacterium MAG19_C2-C3]|nr:endonuclease/exonuclease/phosphatase family protein [Pyrinomonadaceae bacterium MAG19_C2-C3]